MNKKDKELLNEYFEESKTFNFKFYGSLIAVNILFLALIGAFTPTPPENYQVNHSTVFKCDETLKYNVEAPTSGEYSYMVKVVKQAEEWWEKEIGRNLFEFSPGSSFTIKYENIKIENPESNSTIVGLARYDEIYLFDSSKLTAAHEFGHILGLGHSLDANSIMYYSIKKGQKITDSNVQLVKDLCNW